MFEYLNGLIVSCTPTNIVLDVSGVAYNCRCSLNTYKEIGTSDRGKLYVHLHITENAQTMYGFASEEERNFFQKLISVTGVGPTSALLLLSTMPVDELQHAIASGAQDVLQKAKGIGPKVSGQIILDLKGKMSPGAYVPQGSPPAIVNKDEQDAVSALVSLGISKVAASAAVKKVIESGDPGPLESIITKSLKMV